MFYIMGAICLPSGVLKNYCGKLTMSSGIPCPSNNSATVFVKLLQLFVNTWYFSGVNYSRTSFSISMNISSGTSVIPISITLVG